MAGYESEKLGDLMCTHNILNEEDKKWYFSECKRVFKDLHYNLDRRASGDDALKLFLISKGYPIKKALDLSWMKPEDFKKSFKQFLDECANPNKTPEENVKAIAEMNKKAMKAISEYTIPDFSNIKSDKDLAKYQLEIQAMGSLYNRLDSGYAGD